MALIKPPTVDTTQDPAFGTKQVINRSPNNTGVVGQLIDTTYIDKKAEIINEPGGNVGMVQFNVGGSFGGDRSFVYNLNTKTLSIAGNILLGGYINGRITTNLYNLKVAGGLSGQILTTDGNGNLSWQNQAQLQYSNSNVASFLPTHTGNITGNNMHLSGGAYVHDIITSNVTTSNLTISVGGNVNLDVSQLQMTGGASGQVLTTNGSGNLIWKYPNSLESFLTLGNTPITLAQGGTHDVWTGPFDVTPNVVGGFVNSDSSNNALMTFSTVGSNNMSIALDGSLFVGDNIANYDFGHDYNTGGWVVSQNGLIMTDQAASIIFPDTTVQETAYLGYEAIISETNPGNLVDGKIWFDSNEGRAFVMYNQQWVDMNPQIAPNPDLNANSITFEDGSVLTTGNIQGSSYSNSNVASYLPTYTGNISANNVLLSNTLVTSSIQGNTGLVINSTDTMNLLVNNVSGIEVTSGSVGLYAQNILSLQLDGANADFRNQHVNNVNSLNVNGNITGNYIIGNGSQLTDIVTSKLTNTTQTFVLNSDGSFGVKDSGSATNFNLDQTTPNIDLRTTSGTGFFTTGSNITFRAGGSKNWIFDNSGNLSTQGSVKVGATNGNIVVGDATATGSPGLSSTTSVTLTANRDGNATSWVFSNEGSLILPGPAVGQTSYSRIKTDGAFLNLDVQYGSLDDVYDGARVGTNSTDPFDIVTDFNGARNTWRFDSNGNLNLPPTNSIVAQGTPQVGYHIIVTDDFIELQSAADGSGGDQTYVTWDAGASSFVNQIWTPWCVGQPDAMVGWTITSSDNVVTNIIAANNYGQQYTIEVDHYGIGSYPFTFQSPDYVAGSPNPVNIATNSHNWVFGVDGNLSVPGNINVSGTASPAPSLNGFSSVTLTANLRAANIYTDNYYLANGDPLPLVSGSSNVTTTGNVTAGNVIAGNFTGNGSQLTSISGANVTGTVANATYALNAGNAYHVAAANITGTISFATRSSVADSANSVSGSNVSGPVAYATVANSVAAANVSGLGNLALLNKDGNASNILYGNGVFASAPSGGGGIGAINEVLIVNAVAPSTSYTNATVTQWSASYTGSGGQLLVSASITAFSGASGATRNWYLQKNGSTVATGSFYYNTANEHTNLPTINYVDTTGSSTLATWSIFVGSGLTVDGGDRATIRVTEYSGQLNYANSNVTTLLSSFGSSNISTSGNITAGYLIGNGSQLTGLPASYANTNVAAYLPTYTGNVTAGNISVTGTITGGGIRKTTATTAPSSPTVGDQWYNSSTDILYQYINDGVSSYWLDIAGPGYSNPQNVTKVSNFVNAGTFVVLDNLKATVTTSGNRGLAIASVSGTFNCYIGGYGAYNTGTGVAATTSGGSPYAVTTSTGNTSLFAWSFPNASDSITYHINDLTNNRFYRIQMMIGMSYNNNFISIERLI